MSYRHVLYDYASVITKVPECSADELSAQVGDYAVRNPESVYDLTEEFYSLFLEVALTNGMCSIHLENLSTSTNANLKLLGVGLNGPIMSRPQ